MKNSRMLSAYLAIASATLPAKPYVLQPYVLREFRDKPRQSPPRKPDTTRDDREQHNAAIEAKRQAKLAARKARRRTQPTGRV